VSHLDASSQYEQIRADFVPLRVDSPKKLLADPEGYFYKLCARTGELEELKRLADV
jgi:hypothetical protein